jgi:hypothetical protein
MIRVLLKDLELDEGYELADGQAGLPNNCAQSAAIEFFMIGNCGLRRRCHQGDVTSTLAINDEANFAKRLDAFRARDDWQLAHAATSTNST